MDILRNLRVKMIVSIVAVIMLVLAVIFLALDFSLTKAENDKTIYFLELLSQNDGHMPRPELKNDGMGNNPNMIRPEDFDMDGGMKRPEDLDVNGNMKKPDVQKKNQNPPPEMKEKDNASAHGPSDSYRMPDEPPELRKYDLIRSVLPWVHFDLSAGFRNYFSVEVASDGTVSEIIKDFPLNYTDNEISEIIEKIFYQNKDRGLYDGMAYLIRHRRDSSLVCVMNRQSEISTLYQVYTFTCFIYCASLFVAFLMALLLSRWSIRPVAVAFDRQKRFIADAGHELKTPIAVISANIDVLLSDVPDNKWLQYIRDENERMSRLVKDMLFLARSDADRSVLRLSNFDFTAAVNSAVLPFESVIFEQNKKLELTVSEGMKCFGDEAQIKQVIIVLVDNAIKNSDVGALIRVNAFQESQKISLTVYNTGKGIAPDDIDKIFNRFYRADSSRARQTGGYGLGLAIAKTIVEEHGGTLTAESQYGQWAKFMLSLTVNGAREKQRKDSAKNKGKNKESRRKINK